MDAAVCPREAELAAALRAGQLTDVQRAHAAACEACAEALTVTAFLSAGVETAGAPEAGLVWWKLEIRARREAAEKAARPVVLAERLGLAVAAGAAAWACVWLNGLSPALALAGWAGLGVLALVGAGAVWTAARR
jgi:hypothetical protein